MKKAIVLLVLLSVSLATISAGETDTSKIIYLNTVEAMLQKEGKLGLGGYGEVHYSQPLNTGQRDLGQLDVQRLVLFLGYNFSSKTQFVSEIEFEHANELWVEQAFLQHKVNRYINFKAGLLLIPMGIINEFHEPPLFNGVKRPVIDNKIAPTTWREIGIGFAGNYLPLSVKYQLYMVNGVSSYDSKGLFNGNNGMRNGRQKGSNAYASAPNFTGKVEYYGIKNLNLGLSGYFGDSQSKLYNKVSSDSLNLLDKADSSVVSISMVGADFRYEWRGLSLRGQYYYTGFTNTDQYNRFTGQNGTLNDLGRAMTGYYIEAGYNVFRNFSNIKTALIPFIRYEEYNTHYSVDPSVTANDLYHNTHITTGLTYKLTHNAVIKSDLQFIKSAADQKYSKVFNAGIGVMF